LNDKVTNSATYAGSFVTIFGGVWSLNEFAIVGGFLVALMSFLYTIFYKERQARSDREYKQALLAEIKHKDIVSLATEIAKVKDEE